MIRCPRCGKVYGLEEEHRCGYKKVITLDERGFSEIWVKEEPKRKQLNIEHL